MVAVHVRTCACVPEEGGMAVHDQVLKSWVYAEANPACLYGRAECGSVESVRRFLNHGRSQFSKEEGVCIDANVQVHVE